MQEMHIRLEKEMFKDNERMEIAKAGAIDSQDDLRDTRYDLLREYSENNLKKYLFGAKGSVSDNELQVMLSHYSDKISLDSIFIKNKRMATNRYLTDIYRVRAKNRERIYYYEADNVYHKVNICSCLKADKSKVSIYSSMEECALSGAFPCRKCILGYEK